MRKDEFGIKKFPLSSDNGNFFFIANYGVLVGVGVPVAVGVAEAAEVVAVGVELVAVGVAEAAAVVLVMVGVALAGTEALDALKMIGPVHIARSPVAGPVARTVRINFTF